MTIIEIEKKIIAKAHLLRGNLIGGSSHVNLLIHVDTRDDEEDTF